MKTTRTMIAIIGDLANEHVTVQHDGGPAVEYRVHRHGRDEQQYHLLLNMNDERSMVVVINGGPKPVLFTLTNPQRDLLRMHCFSRLMTKVLEALAAIEAPVDDEAASLQATA